jgi:hypothetical protein
MSEHSLLHRGRLSAGAFALALLFLAVPVGAHHGWGGYLDAEFELTGTVESPVSTAGPHATMKVRANGNVWNVVLAPPARTEAGGLKNGMLPVGTQVTLHGHRHRDPKVFEIKTERVMSSGKEYNVYPDRS